MIDLTGKVAIVTGGASGIGTGICHVLANQGASIVVCDINLDNAKSVALDIESKEYQTLAIQTDVAQKDSVNNMVDHVINTFGQIDILVNDAGVMGASDWQEKQLKELSASEKASTDEDWDASMSINLMGVVYTSEAASVHMKKQRSGKIINIASTAARVGGAGPAIHYGVSKAAALYYTQCSALQLAPFNINVNCICPGIVWTPMVAARGTKKAKSKGITWTELMSSGTPMQRPQTPEDIGKLTAFLASDDACNITGQAINIDGGSRLD